MPEKVIEKKPVAHMQWASALGTGSSLEACLSQAAQRVRAQLGPRPLDLVVVFVSSAWRARYDDVPALLGKVLPAGHVLGCSGGGVIGAGADLGTAPGVSLTAARLPEVLLQPFRLQTRDMPDLDGPQQAWETVVGLPAAQSPHFLLVGDPFSFPVENLVMGLDFAYPRAVKIGGLASDSMLPGGNCLFLDGQAYHSGLVGMALHGDLDIDVLVTPGCRPIGRPVVVTHSQRNLIIQLARRPALEVLGEMLLELPPHDQTLARTSLLVGVQMDPLQPRPEVGDYLVRNIVGMDPNRGILAVGTTVRPGQLVRFHLNDAEASAQALRTSLDRHLTLRRGAPVAGLVFSCLGRGGVNDPGLIADRLGAMPLGGFYSSGEIGPVGGSTYVHGFTSCVGLIHQPDAD